ncbi:MFS transporter [Mycoplasmatota bacterium zrk1]
MKKYAVSVFSLLTFVIVVEFSVVMPLGPQIADMYGVSRNSVTLLFIGYTLMGLLTPVNGFLSDKFGLKKIIIINVAIFSAGAFISSFVTTSTGYFIGRTVIGIGYFTITSLVIVYSSKIISYERLGFVSGIYKFAFASAMFASPIIGSFYVRYLNVSKLYFSIGVATLLILAMLIPLPEVASDSDINLRDIKNLLKKQDVILMMIAVFMLATPSVFFFNYLGIYLQGIGYTVAESSRMFTIVASGSIFAAILIILFSDKIGKLRMARWGIYLSTGAILGFVFDYNITIIIFSVLFGIGYDTIWGLFFTVSSKMFKKGVNSFITILSMAMSGASVVTNSVAPLVMARWGFIGNILVAFSAFVICIMVFNYVMISYENKLN